MDQIKGDFDDAYTFMCLLQTQDAAVLTDALVAFDFCLSYAFDECRRFDYHGSSSACRAAQTKEEILQD